MKHLRSYRAIVAIAMMLIGWLPSLAHDFKVEGVFYNKTSDNTVAVTYKGSYSSTYVGEYVGDVVIPSSVNYEGITYSVTSIGESAFSGCLSLTSIQIPNSVTSIGSNAFWGCSKLTSVVIPNSVTSIGDETFGHCDNLTSIQIPNSVTSVGDGAFYYCKNLTSIVVDSGNTIYDSRNGCNAIIETASNTLIAGCKNTIIPNSVTSIGEKAFYFCFSLTIIEIPNSVTSIGDLAFWYCSSLTSIKIPNSVTSIGKNAFSSCKSLTSIVVDAGNTKYDSRNDCNAIIETASNTLILGCKNSKIPNSVTSIGEKAFYYCSSLTSIEIPNSVKGIGSMAFYDCENLISIEIPNSVTFISNYAFTGCDNLTKITCLATTPPRIGSGTFTNYSADLYVPAGCKESYEAAEYWNKYTNIIELEPELEEGATFEYEGLTYKVVVKGEELAVIASESGKYSGDIVIPQNIECRGVTYNVTSIGEKAFYYCSSLTSIEIPNSVTSIGGKAFSGCSSLTNIEIPNSVTSIESSAFYWCSKLTSIKIPNSVTSIGKEAFSMCSSLTNIEIPNSVTSIESSAFYGCSSLTSIEIPNSVTSIGYSAFNGCKGLTSIVVDASNSKYDSRNGCNAIIETASNTLIAGCQNTIIPNSVTSIGSLAFLGCKSLTSIKIPNSVTSIGNSAFKNCTGLTSIEIPNSVTSIGDNTFNGCTNLTSIEIPNSVTSIGYSAFNGCDKLTKITCLATNPPTIRTDIFSNYDAELYVPAGCKSVYEAADYWNKFSNIIELPTLATSIALDKTEIELEATQTATLVVTVLPELATDKSVTWTSSDEEVATVDENGVVTAIAVGEATITATTTDGSNLSASCKVIVNPTLATSITLDKTEVELEATQTATLVVTVLPELATDKSVTWSSSNESVATVDENGVVTAIAVGEATITATTIDGTNLSASCKVIVNPTLATSISLDKTEVELEATQTTTLVVTVLPDLTTDKSVTWTSSDEEVATVDENGVVTAIAVGEATITATTTDGSNLSASCKVIVNPTLATSITLDKTEVELEATQTATLVVTVLPELATDKSVTWSSSNESVATVDENGVVTAIAVGEATITATTIDGTNLSASCKVIVNPTLATSISLDKTEVELEATQTTTLVVTVLPELTTNKSVTWTSSNEAVATVDANGVVTAIALGEAVITATTTDGSNLSATCKVTVVPTLAETITLDKTEISLEATETATLVATVLPELTTNKSVTWTSSNEAVATVDANGVVTAIAVGEAVITATTTDGSNLSATCKVTVVATLAETITLDKTEISIEATETATLVATVLPELTTNKSVIWTSSYEAVATVDANGVVTAIALGEAVITATTTDGSNLSASCKVTVVPTLAETITLDKTEISLEATETATLVATVLPELTTNKSVTWKSSNEAVATVDANGVVTAIAVGEAIITVTTTDGSNLSTTCKVTVVPTLAETIALDKTEISLEATETATLIATVLPELTTNKSVTWTSSNEAVATVDANGVVTAVAVGEAVITVTTTDGSNLSTTCKVTVVPTLAETITLDKTEISFEATETATLVATVLPELTTNKSVIWTSSYEAVATVDANGVVTAVAVGEAVITVTTTDESNLSTTCKVTVVPTLAVSIEVTPNSVEAEENSEVQLSVNVLPENATYKSVEWTSSNDAIASVDANGLVKIYKEGNVVITATTTDGTNLSATCSINVYSGINGVNGNDVIVATIGDNILVKNAPLGSNVRVYAADGAMIATEIVTDGSVVIEAPIKGIYVVAIDGKSFKVMVK